MKSFITSSELTETDFSPQEKSTFCELIKALAAGDFLTLNDLLPDDRTDAARRLTLRFDAFIQNVEKQNLPPDVTNAIGQQISMFEFVKKMLK